MHFLLQTLKSKSSEPHPPGSILPLINSQPTIPGWSIRSDDIIDMNTYTFSHMTEIELVNEESCIIKSAPMDIHNLSTFHFLNERGIDVKGIENGNLLWATLEGHLDILMFILSKRDLYSKVDQAIIMTASMSCQLEIVNHLLAIGYYSQEALEHSLILVMKSNPTTFPNYLLVAERLACTLNKVYY